jgi:predicted glycosyltransferase
MRCNRGHADIENRGRSPELTFLRQTERGRSTRILIDITHPAYAHFFRTVITSLHDEGHEVLLTSREKDVTTELLDAWGLRHVCISRSASTPHGLLAEMLVRVARLCREMRRFRPDVVLARDGLFACQAGWLCRVRSISFEDTDDALIQHALYFPFAWRIYTDPAYPRRLGRKQRFMSGISCLAYLRPPHFARRPETLHRLGLDTSQKIMLVRLVSWTSNHDIGQRGFGSVNLRRVVARLSKAGQVVISTEVPLDGDLERYRIDAPATEMHNLMAHCNLYVGESATMAAEAAVLGVPAIHVSTRRLWYTDLLENRFGLVTNVRNGTLCLETVERILRDPTSEQRQRERRDCYLRETDDLIEVVLDAVEEAVSS